MEKLIDFGAYPVSGLLDILLKDKTTNRNIIFATDEYRIGCRPIEETAQIKPKLLKGHLQYKIQPRVLKNREQQQIRTRTKAEVFTPSWMCNKMNNHCDEEWFGRSGVFNIETAQGWTVNTKRISFKAPNDWQKYIDSRRLEITCGEAPYIISRYDTTTGETIDIVNRIGILDRKLRIVNENTDNEKDWLKWVLRAYQSVYGYEFQGDNLLIARINLLMTFVDYMEDAWDRKPTEKELQKIAKVIAWNFWQMDGISGTVPYGKPKEEPTQCSLFDFEMSAEKKAETEQTQVETDCRIYDWRSNKSVIYKSMREEK